MKVLNGSELAGYIKARQARVARTLQQANSITPKLAIVQTKDDPVIDTYVRLKTQYGADIGVAVDAYRIDQSECHAVIDKLNNDPAVSGIIVQLPLAEPSATDEIVNLVAPQKDVDALGENAKFEPATPMAILWLLAGYNIDLTTKNVVLVGHGKLVGAPMERILRQSGIAVTVVDKPTATLQEVALKADVLITATGSPALIHANMVKHGAVVVDAGIASEGGKTVGDTSPDVYERDDITITPAKGGVGPLTVCALFENVIRAAELSARQPS